VSPITGANNTQKEPAPLQTGTGAIPAPLQTGTEQVKTASAPLQTDTGSPNAPVKTASEQPNNLKIPSEVKPLPIALIDDLITQGYNRAGIESILKANGHTSHRSLISERMKVVKPADKAASNPASTLQTPQGIGAGTLDTSATTLDSGAGTVNSPATNPASTLQDVPSTKTPENTSNSGISRENRVAQLLAALQTGSSILPAPLPTGSAPQQTVPAQLPAGSGAAPAGLPTDLPSILAVFQQFLAAYKQALNSVPAASEQVNESDSTHMIPISG
jgi:hypothetical protein